MASDIFPLLLPSVDKTPAVDRPGFFQLTLDGAATPVVLAGGALMVIEEFDGARTPTQIFEGLAQQGVPLPGVDFVLALADAMEGVGLVEKRAEPRSRPYRRKIPPGSTSVDPLRHQCFGCGRSCQGHLIGPLDDAFLSRAQRLHDELAEVHEDLRGLAPVREVEEEEEGARRVAMTSRDNGACIYLGEDNRCRIHAHHGADQKPLVCRLFPLNIIKTETGVRIGVPLRCYFTHKSLEGGAPERSPAEIIGLGDDEQAPRPTPRSADPATPGRLVLNPTEGSIYARNVESENNYLWMLDQPDFKVSTLLLALHTTVATKPLEEHPEHPVHQTRFGERLIERLRRLGATLTEEAGAYEPDTNNAEVAALGAFLSALEDPTFEGLTAAQRRLTRYALRQHVFLREWHQTPSLTAGVLATLCGAIAASWRSDATEADGDEVDDMFAFTLTCWTKSLRHGHVFMGFLEDPDDLQDLVEGLGESLLDTKAEA